MIHPSFIILYEQEPEIIIMPECPDKLYKDKTRTDQNPADRTFEFKYRWPIRRPRGVALGAHGNVKTELSQVEEDVSASSQVTISRHRSLMYENLTYYSGLLIPDIELEAIDGQQLTRARREAARIAVADALTRLGKLEPYYVTVARTALGGGFTKH